MKRVIKGLDTSGDKLLKAITAVLDGTVTRADISPDIKVYECKDTIRIDLKITKED